jgi:hypothetical protein
MSTNQALLIWRLKMELKDVGKEQPVGTMTSQRDYDPPKLTVFGDMQTITQIDIAGPTDDGFGGFVAAS